MSIVPSFAFALGQHVLVTGWDAECPPPARVTARRFEERLGPDGEEESQAFYQIEVMSPDGLVRSRIAEAGLVASPDPVTWPPAEPWYSNAPPLPESAL